MNILAIIPARGGSKGIPGKNTRYLCGKPLLAWTIQTAKGSKFINRVIVSTDDAEISRIANEHGAQVILRPQDLSTDTASSESALLHVLKELQHTEGYHPDILVFLQCTSPLTAVDDIDNCIDRLLQEAADTCTTVTDFHYFLWKETVEGAVGVNHDKHVRERRQDREKQYLETGAVYAMKASGFLQNRHRFFGKTVLCEVPGHRVLEIDEPVDLLVAEVRLREMLSKDKSTRLPSTIKAVFFDFDGVMTDNKVMVSESGMESVLCNRGDGMGIKKLKEASIQVVVMSTEKNPIVAARCKKLEIECFQDLGHTKHKAVMKWCKNNGISLQETVFVGNDINDIEAMKIVGCSVVPLDAHADTLAYADIILDSKGGQGAVRELCDMIKKNYNV